MDELRTTLSRLAAKEGGQAVLLELKDAAFELVALLNEQLQQHPVLDADREAAKERFSRASSQAAAIVPELRDSLPEANAKAAIDLIRELVLSRRNH